MSGDVAVRSAWARSLPNLLSALRLGLAGVFPWLPDAVRLPAVVVAAGTDLLDGFLARRWGVQTVAGGLLDAVADKAFALSVILVLALQGTIDWWQILLVLARDVVVVMAAGWFAMRREWAAFHAMPARWSGKAATMFVFLWFVTLVTPGTDALRAPVFVVTAAASVGAALDYLIRFGRAVIEGDS